jgi:hypothetical protein
VTSREIRSSPPTVWEGESGERVAPVEFEGLDRYNSVSKCLSYTYSVFAQNVNHILKREEGCTLRKTRSSAK